MYSLWRWAGACIISATNDKSEAIIDVNASADGSYADFLVTPALVV